jgi:DNA mismatch repair protein MutS2
VRNLAEILRSATERSLVLIDELGSGTDPLEGAALGGAVLEELTRRGTLTVATTHLGALKELASEVPGVVNASLQFDEAALAPTYALIKGIPGRSYGIGIARRLRLPEHVIARAEERVPRAERDVNALLASLEAREVELAAREREVAESREAAQTRAHALAERERRLRERERALERDQRKEARRYLLEARAEVERTIKELRGLRDEELEAAARAARQHVEQLAAEQGSRLARLEERARSPVTAPAEEAAIAANDWVRVESLGGREGRVTEVRGEDAVVALGAVKMTFPANSLRRIERPRDAGDVSVPVRGDLPEVSAASEIDVRGMRVVEVDDLVLQALDAAIRADLRSLRIIHGKGTGALRDRVAEMLRKDTRVKSFRLGAWNEGGAGVTVAEF